MRGEARSDNLCKAFLDKTLTGALESFNICDYFNKEDIMSKVEIGSDRIYYPMPCSLVGANVAGKANYLTVAWFSMVNPEPAYLAVAMNKAHYTNSGIKANGTFSVNIPSSDMAEKTDYCGMVSGRKFDKAAIFETFYGKLETAPMIKEFPFNVECRLVQTVDLPAEELFSGKSSRLTAMKAVSLRVPLT